MKKFKILLAVFLASLIALSCFAPGLRLPTKAESNITQLRSSNNAYLPFGWIYRSRSADFINEKLDLIKTYGIDTVYFSMGSVSFNSTSGITLKNSIAENISNGVDSNLAKWIKYAQLKNINIIPILNCSLNDYFLSINPNTAEPYANEAKAVLLEAAQSFINNGFSFDNETYHVNGIHFDCEPFKSRYHSFYLDMLSSFRNIIGHDKTLSSATPACNGAWSDSYLAQVGSYLDTINPMIYDSNGPEGWGNVNGGVTRTPEDYIQLVENTCLWYNRVFTENNIACEISPTVPSYPDIYTESDIGWPDSTSNIAWYHLTKIENVTNCIKGVERANLLGADIKSLGVWNFYYMCGDDDEYQPKTNGYYNPLADTLSWKSWVMGRSISDISYNDSLADLSNPERGFYRPAAIRLTPSGGESYSLPSTKLVHLRFGLSAFSPSTNNGQELSLTEATLAFLSNVFNSLRANSQTAVIRFAYDDFLGTQDMEPSIDMIEEHIEALSPVLTQYQDVIASVEAGFIGPWGEMHSSTMANTQVFNRLINALIASVPDSIGITVRQPIFYADWRGIDIANIDSDLPDSTSTAYRIGVFNDGYLGSASDLGTYRNRDKEVAWLSRQATHTMFGGEAVLSNNDRTYNCIEFISEEMFKTHTTYLNIEWNNTLIGYWQNETYNGNDIEYLGQSAFKYINDHLGYRFILRSAAIEPQASSSVGLSLAIYNAGCANVIKAKTASLIFVQGEKTFETALPLDITKLLTRETAIIDSSFAIPTALEDGQCEVYIRIADPTANASGIAFANEGIYNTELRANYIGSFRNIKQAEEPTIEPTTEPATEPTTEPFVEPTTEPIIEPTTEPATERCGCLCHSQGFMAVIWKIIRFIAKLFNIIPICDCGVAHY